MESKNLNLGNTELKIMISRGLIEEVLEKLVNTNGLNKNLVNQCCLISAQLQTTVQSHTNLLIDFDTYLKNYSSITVSTLSLIDRVIPP